MFYPFKSLILDAQTTAQTPSQSYRIDLASAESLSIFDVAVKSHENHSFIVEFIVGKNLQKWLCIVVCLLQMRKELCRFFISARDSVV